MTTPAIWRIAFIAMSSFLVAACGNIPPMNFSVPSVGPSQVQIPAEVRSLTVTLARPDEQTGNIPLGSESLTALWATSLREALNRMVIFRDDSPKKVSISVKVLKIDIPGVGASFTTTTAARYEIIDRSNGDIIFTQDIETSGTTPFDHAFLGVARARESVNRSVQNNIGRFLQALETVDVTKPMFPGRAQPPASSPEPSATPARTSSLNVSATLS
jgi:hypothetical protein